MAKQFIVDIKEGDNILSNFVAQDPQLIPHKNKAGYYLQLYLCDKTGSIKAFCWDDAEKYYEFTKGNNVIKVKGKAEIYNEKLQVRIFNISLPNQNEFELEDFIQSSKKNLEELYVQLEQEIKEIKNPFISQILIKISENTPFFSAIKKAPASKSIHHAYIGGLLEHTLNCITIGKKICEIYPFLRKDLLLAGIMLHDIGKIKELSYKSQIEYTTEGRLLGHIFIGAQIISETCNEIPNFPKILKDELLHLILSHHGSGEMGSPKPPQTIEAIALHLIDNLDAQIERFSKIIEKANIKAGEWTPYDTLLERYLYKGQLFIDEENK